MWEDTTGSLESTKRLAGLLAEKGIRHELDLWGHDVPHDWPSWRAQIAHHLPTVLLMSDETTHLIGLLLGTEEDWPTRLRDAASRGSGRSRTRAARRTASTTERITIEPFDLRDKPRYDLVVDRLAYWYYLPREWLKKVALMDDVYLLNSPFTFQAMEKHAAYCAMLRLGLKVPQTVLVPHKNPPDNARFAYTAAKYNQPFDLDEIAEEIGYPLFMKPYDGGQWVGVSRIKRRARAAPRLRRVRPAADAPAGVGRGLRRVRALAVDRRRDDGHELPARPADARPLRRRRTTSSRPRSARRC